MHIRKLTKKKLLEQNQGSNLSQSALQLFSDEKLLCLAQKYGEQARLWRQRFAGLLPEVNRRRLYEKMGCQSVFVFAKKLAGMSEEQTRNVLNLDRQFQDFPLFHKILVNGEISINKLIRVCSVLKNENEEFWANQVRILSNRALETLIKDEKTVVCLANGGEENVGLFSVMSLVVDNADFKNQNGFAEPKSSGAELHVQPGKNAEIGKALCVEGTALKGAQPEGNAKVGGTRFEGNIKIGAENEPPQLEELARPLSILKLQLAKDVTEEILELQRKGIDINQLLREFLHKREQEIAVEKTALHEQAVASVNAGKPAVDSAQQSAAVSAQKSTHKPSRYVSVKIKNLFKKEFGKKCAIPICDNLSVPIHHGQRFALAKYHDPFFMAPLCTEHHQIAHSIDLKYKEKRSG